MLLWDTKQHSCTKRKHGVPVLMQVFLQDECGDMGRHGVAMFCGERVRYPNYLGLRRASPEYESRWKSIEWLSNVKREDGCLLP